MTQADPWGMGVRLGFADVLLSKLADVPPPLVPGRQDARIASPYWAHRLEPLRAVPASFLHSRYRLPASAAPAAGGIPMADGQASSRGGLKAPFAPAAAQQARTRPARRRTPREQLGITLLNRLGANVDAGAADEEIRSAYRRLLRSAHPDMHPDASPGQREGHARTLRAIVRAWDVFKGRASGFDA